MEKPHLENITPPQEGNVLWEKVMKKVDILMANKFDYKKTGEIIRLNDYLKELSLGNNNIVPPEPNAELINTVDQSKIPFRNIQVEFSADEMFARWVYHIIPKTAKEKGWKHGFEMLEQFVGTLAENTN
jgi:hypothetical protein